MTAFSKWLSQSQRDGQDSSKTSAIYSSKLAFCRQLYYIDMLWAESEYCSLSAEKNHRTFPAKYEKQWVFMLFGGGDDDTAIIRNRSRRFLISN